jgi:hypothetical protein
MQDTESQQRDIAFRLQGIGCRPQDNVFLLPGSVFPLPGIA